MVRQGGEFRDCESITDYGIRTVADMGVYQTQLRDNAMGETNRVCGNKEGKSTNARVRLIERLQGMRTDGTDLIPVHATNISTADPVLTCRRLRVADALLVRGDCAVGVFLPPRSF